MSMRDDTRKGSLVGFGLMLAAVTMFVLGASASVLAHHSSDHSGGPPASSGAEASGTEVTEDNDPDGVPNAPDPVGDADNRHPSGKDKHVEAGGSGNQGNTSSEPDGNGSGPERDVNGVDQPGGPGGWDVLDQDGNNGCGNDDDFEDDNEGWCGKPPTPPAGETTPPTTETTPPPTTKTTPPTTTETTPPAAVLGVQGGGGAGGAGVLGEAVAAAGEGAVGAVGAGGALAFTGFEAWPLALLAVGLALPGLILVWIGRRRARTT